MVYWTKYQFFTDMLNEWVLPVVKVLQILDTIASYNLNTCFACTLRKPHVQRSNCIPSNWKEINRAAVNEIVMGNWCRSHDEGASSALRHKQSDLRKMSEQQTSINLHNSYWIWIMTTTYQKLLVSKQSTTYLHLTNCNDVHAVSQ